MKVNIWVTNLNSKKNVITLFLFFMMTIVNCNESVKILEFYRMSLLILLIGKYFTWWTKSQHILRYISAAIISYILNNRCFSTIEVIIFYLIFIPISLFFFYFKFSSQKHFLVWNWLTQCVLVIYYVTYMWLTILKLNIVHYI